MELLAVAGVAVVVVQVLTLSHRQVAVVAGQVLD